MKLNKIWLFFYTALPVNLALRVFQLLFTIDAKTGFYTAESGNYGIILLILIFVFCIATFVFALFVHNRPENPPKTNPVLSIAAFFLAMVIICEMFFGSLQFSFVGWQTLVLKIAGIFAALFFLWYCLSPAIGFRLSPTLATVPAIYFTARLICDFTAISKLALISDNIILIVTYCVILLFFLNFAKLYNDVNKEKNFKNLLSTGLCGAMLCLINSVPNIVVNFISQSGYLHTSMTTNLILLFTGLFIIVFLHSHFSKKNLSI